VFEGWRVRLKYHSAPKSSEFCGECSMDASGVLSLADHILLNDRQRTPGGPLAGSDLLIAVVWIANC
jgi:hypothetical protein